MNCGAQNNAQLPAQLERLEVAHGLKSRTALPFREISTQTDTQGPNYRAINSLRQGDSPESPLTPRALEYCRRIVEEGGCSFKGASTVVSLVLAMVLADGPDVALMISQKTFKNAFELLGAADDESLRAANRAGTSYWSAAGDGASERRALHLMAIVWRSDVSSRR